MPHLYWSCTVELLTTGSAAKAMCMYVYEQVLVMFCLCSISRRTADPIKYHIFHKTYVLLSLVAAHTHKMNIPETVTHVCCTPTSVITYQCTALPGFSCCVCWGAFMDSTGRGSQIFSIVWYRDSVWPHTEPEPRLAKGQRSASGGM